MTGLELKLRIGQARHDRATVGSLALPETQERRLFAKLEDARQDVRALTKVINSGSNKMAFGLGASAIATLVAGAGVVWAAHENAKRVKKFGR